MAAVAAVESGACDVALVFRSVNREWGQQSGKVVVPPAENAAQFSLPYGDFGGIIPSMGMRKYRRLAELGGSEEDYGQIALNARTWAAMYERGVLTKPLTMDDYLSSRFVAEPLRLLDCDYPVTGCLRRDHHHRRACPRPGRPPGDIDSVAFGTGSRPDWTFSDDLLFGGTIGCARACGKSRVTAADVDVAELYDGFTHITISWIEALGLCGIGEFGDWVDGGKRIGPGGRCRSTPTAGSSPPVGCTVSRSSPRRWRSCAATAGAAGAGRPGGRGSQRARTAVRRDGTDPRVTPT